MTNVAKLLHAPYTGRALRRPRRLSSFTSRDFLVQEEIPVAVVGVLPSSASRRGGRGIQRRARLSTLMSHVYHARDLCSWKDVRGLLQRNDSCVGCMIVSQVPFGAHKHNSFPARSPAA